MAVVDRTSLAYAAFRWSVVPPACTRLRGARNDMTDEVLAIMEIAELLKLAEKTVYSMAQRGELPTFRVRGQWRIRRADMDL